jgi:hypothetical protein
LRINIANRYFENGTGGKWSFGVPLSDDFIESTRHSGPIKPSLQAGLDGPGKINVDLYDCNCHRRAFTKNILGTAE